MAIVRTAFLMSAALTGPALFLEPPLATSADKSKPSYAVNRLSPMAMAGHGIYQRLCAECHGTNADGTARGPELLKPASRPGKKARIRFHRAVTRGFAPGVKGHGLKGFGPMPAFDLSFNRIEMIGRFLRELADRGR